MAEQNKKSLEEIFGSGSAPAPAQKKSLDEIFGSAPSKYSEREMKVRSENPQLAGREAPLTEEQLKAYERGSAIDSVFENAAKTALKVSSYPLGVLSTAIGSPITKAIEKISGKTPETEIVSDVVNAVKGSPVPSTEYYRRMGVPSGYSTADVFPRLKGTESDISLRDILGLATDSALQGKIGQGIRYGAGKVAPALAKIHFRPTPTQMRQLGDEGFNEVANEAYRSGVIEPFGTVNKTAKNIESQLNMTGEQLGSARKQWGDAGFGVTGQALEEALKKGAKSINLRSTDNALEASLQGIGRDILKGNLPNYTGPVRPATITRKSQFIPKGPAEDTLNMTREIYPTTEPSPAGGSKPQTKTYLTTGQSKRILDFDPETGAPIYVKNGFEEYTTKPVIAGTLESNRARPKVSSIDEAIKYSLENESKLFATDPNTGLPIKRITEKYIPESVPAKVPSDTFAEILTELGRKAYRSQGEPSDRALGLRNMVAEGRAADVAAIPEFEQGLYASQRGRFSNLSDALNMADKTASLHRGGLVGRIVDTGFANEAAQQAAEGSLKGLALLGARLGTKGRMASAFGVPAYRASQLPNSAINAQAAINSLLNFGDKKEEEKRRILLNLNP